MIFVSRIKHELKNSSIEIAKLMRIVFNYNEIQQEKLTLRFMLTMNSWAAQRIQQVNKKLEILIEMQKNYVIKTTQLQKLSVVIVVLFTDLKYLS